MLSLRLKALQFIHGLCEEGNVFPLPIPPKVAQHLNTRAVQDTSPFSGLQMLKLKLRTQATFSAFPGGFSQRGGKGRSRGAKKSGERELLDAYAAVRLR